MVVLPGCRVHSAYVQLATLLNLVMSAILFFWQRDMRDVVYFVLECLNVMTS